jgi:hypothetical protein
MPAYGAYEFVAIVRAPMMFPDRGWSRLAGTSNDPHRCPCLALRPASGSISLATGFQMVCMSLGALLYDDETERGVSASRPAERF